MKKIFSLVGARPQFIKEAVVGAEVRRLNAWRHVLVHSGQHYDANMSDVFFQELDMKQPDHFLGVGSGSHAQQTADVHTLVYYKKTYGLQEDQFDRLNDALPLIRHGQRRVRLRNRTDR